MNIDDEVVQDLQRALREKNWLCPDAIAKHALSAVLPKLMGKAATITDGGTKPVDVAAVREQCAKLAEDFRDKHWIAHDIKIGIYPNKSEAGIAIAAAIRALSAEPAQREQWQPIETAPKDGKSVIVYDSFVKSKDGFSQVIARFDEENGWHVAASVVGGIYIKLTNPTHWMPLPPAPEEGCAALAQGGES